MRSLSFHKPTLVLIGAFMVACAAIWWYFLSRPSLGAVSRSIVLANYSGNPGPAVANLGEYELKRMGLTRDQARDLLMRFVYPKLAGSKVESFQESGTTSHGILGLSVYTVRLPDGRLCKMGSSVELSDSGPMYMLRDAFHEAWTIDYLNAHPGVDRPDIKGLLYGMEKDVPALKAYGIRSFVPSVESHPLRSLDEALEVLKKLVAAGAGPARIGYKRGADGKWTRVQ